MKRLGTALAPHPKAVVTGVVLTAFLIWSLTLYPIVSQVGKPFPGFFYTADCVVSAFTPQDFTGWQAGLRPWDRIVAVNGQPWREMRQVVQEAGIGGTVVYTVERGGQRLQVAIPTMELTSDVLWRFLPGYLFFALVSLAVGIFVYARHPSGRLNRYLLFYLLAWAALAVAMWEYFLGQEKWTSVLIHPATAFTAVAGWIFFWSFPADRARREFLARWPLIPAFLALAASFSVWTIVIYILASTLDRPTLWRLNLWSGTWGNFLLFGMGSVINKTLPLLQIALRKGSPRLVRQQATVLLMGIGLGLAGWLLFVWAPATVNLVPPGNTQWGSLIGALYPLSVGYAVLRYQLFDIRVVVRKGLVYSLLTASLTAVFLLLSVVSGYLFQWLTGQRSLFAAPLPALLVAILFQPARDRIQTFVDKAFFSGGSTWRAGA